MILQIFTVLDRKAEAYLSPFFANAIGSAIRSFGDVSKNPEHDFFKHSSDFVLVHLGTFDDCTALFDVFDIPRQIATASEFQV